MAGENRQSDFLGKCPLGHTPLLELDDGRCVAESLAICEYFDETLAGHALLGATAEERARTRMLVRIIDQQVVVPMTTGFRGAEGLAMFQPRGSEERRVGKECGSQGKSRGAAEH